METKVKYYFANSMRITGEIKTIAPCQFAELRKLGPEWLRLIAGFIERTSVTMSNECWLWMGNTQANKMGHGLFYIGKDNSLKRGAHIVAHRFAYLLFIGLIPDGELVRHSCHVPNCVNPAHLVLGSAIDNRADCVRANRQAKGNQIGTSKLVAEDVRYILKVYKRGTRRNPGSSGQLAKKFGVSRSAIECIVNFEYWRHLQSPEQLLFIYDNYDIMGPDALSRALGINVHTLHCIIHDADVREAIVKE